MLELIIIALFLGFLALLVFGVLGLVRPSLAGVGSRGWVALVYFGGAFFLLLAIVVLYPDSPSGVLSDTASSDTPSKMSPKETVPVMQLMQAYSTKTELQRTAWNENQRWRYTVTGRCRVMEVNKTTVFSTISEADYEVDCDLGDGYHAVLFFTDTDESSVLALNRDTTITFTGRLKTITDWEAWQSAYVQVNDFTTH